MKGKWVSGTTVDRRSKETEFEVRSRLKTDFLAMNEWLRTKDLAELADEAVIADAVAVEPVSAGISPDIREKYRECVGLPVPDAMQIANSPAIGLFFTKLSNDKTRG